MILETILEILKYTLPAIIVLISSYMIVKKFLVTETTRKQIALMHDTKDTTIRYRLQAYERLVLFIERIAPQALVPRIYQKGMSAADLRAALVFNINAEFEHNLSQQVYVSKEVWQTVRGVKDQEVNMINHIHQQLGPNASAVELHKKIVEYVLTAEGELPTDIALQIIQGEAKRVLSTGSL
jgi:hypothetical protein